MPPARFAEYTRSMTRHGVCLAAFVLCFLALAACDTAESSGNNDGIAPVVIDGDAGADAADIHDGTPSEPDARDPDAQAADTDDAPTQSMRPCAESSDCVGGQLCFDGICRDFCSDVWACPDDGSVCDVEAGMCVACLSDDDCGATQTCYLRSCIASCTDDDDCGGDQICRDVAPRTCVARACNDSAECPGGEVCGGGICVDAADIVCTPGEARCDDGNLTTCNRSGTAETTVPCGDNPCITAVTGGSCAAPACAPLEVRCVGPDQVEICDATGTRATVFGCPDTQYCDGGRCTDMRCVPDSSRCVDAQTLLICDARGAVTERRDCPSEAPDCGPHGCRCEESDGVGACAPRSCVPGTRRCDGDEVLVCSADGRVESTVETCSDEFRCVAGACLERDCTGTNTRCESEYVVACVDGVLVEQEDCGGASKFCQVTGGNAVCRNRNCSPGHRRCAPDDPTRTQVCNERGSAYTTTPCGDAYRCLDGACVPMVCAPGTVVCCHAGEATCQCTAEGQIGEIVQTCSSDASCSGGACACPAGERLCGGRCVNVATDSAHCGDCDMRCPVHATCRDGTCRCDAGFTRCGASCVDTNISAAHCGSCDSACADGDVCRDGTCEAPSCSCPFGFPYCRPGQGNCTAPNGCCTYYAGCFVNYACEP